MEERLVVVVASYPELYDFTDRNYHDLNKKQIAWRQIGAALETSEDECRKKWKYLRDKYLKERRTEKEKRSGAEGGGIQKRWKFMAAISFLEPHVKERPTTSNFQISQDSTVESLLLPMVSQVEDDLLAETFEASSASPIPASTPSEPLLTPAHHPPRSQIVETPVKHTNNGRKRRCEELSEYQREILAAVNKPLDECEFFYEFDSNNETLDGKEEGRY